MWTFHHVMLYFYFYSKLAYRAGEVPLHSKRSYSIFEWMPVPGSTWKFFGCQCQGGGMHENPNIQEFLKNIQALYVVNSFCRDIVKGVVNCQYWLLMSFPVHIISCIIAFINAVWCVHSVGCCGMITCCWVFFTSVWHHKGKLLRQQLRTWWSWGKRTSPFRNASRLGTSDYYVHIHHIMIKVSAYSLSVYMNIKRSKIQACIMSQTVCCGK